VYIGKSAVWLRFFDQESQVIPTFGEAEAAVRLAMEVELTTVREELARLRGE